MCPCPFFKRQSSFFTASVAPVSSQLFQASVLMILFFLNEQQSVSSSMEVFDIFSQDPQLNWHVTHRTKMKLVSMQKCIIFQADNKTSCELGNNMASDLNTSSCNNLFDQQREVSDQWGWGCFCLPAHSTLQLHKRLLKVYIRSERNFTDCETVFKKNCMNETPFTKKSINKLNVWPVVAWGRGDRQLTVVYSLLALVFRTTVS